MMLDIVITHYNEPWEVVRPLLYMLALQKGIDFNELRVHIVHDGVEAFPDEWFDWMPFKPLQSVIKHGGVSAARNYGLDHSDAKWVCFCDADDTFTDVYSLKYVFDCLSADRDMMWSPFIQECRNKAITMNDWFNTIWIHNKYYRVQFLRDHNFRFGETLVYGEDSAFNSTINLEIKPERIGKIKAPVPLYLWSYREGSATTAPENVLRNMIGQFDRNLYMINEMKKRKDPETLELIGRTLTDCYTHLTRLDPPDGIEKLERRVASFYRKYKEYIDQIPPDTMQKLQDSSDGEAHLLRFFNRNRPERDEWLRRLEVAYV